MAKMNTAAQIRFDQVIQECEAKQQRIRLKWFEKNYEKVYKNPTLPPDKIPKKAATLYDEIRKMRKETFEGDRKDKEKEKKKSGILPRIALDPEFTEEEIRRPKMYPVEPQIKALLYKGVSHNDEGRKLYLKVRNEPPPYDKYYESQTYGMDYGWKVEERGPKAMKDHCRIAIIQPSFYRRMGAGKEDSPRKRPPFCVGQVAFEVL